MLSSCRPRSDILAWPLYFPYTPPQPSDTLQKANVKKTWISGVGTGFSSGAPVFVMLIICFLCTGISLLVLLSFFRWPLYCPYILDLRLLITFFGFTTTYVISAFHHCCCEFESQPGWGVQHYVIKFVSDLRQVGCFFRILRFPPPIKLTATI